MDKKSLTNFYTSVLAFLVMSKHQIIDIGATHHLNAMQVFTLLFLDPEDPRQMSLLSTSLGCDPSNVTVIIDSLEKRSLISRIDKPGDRRVKMVRLEQNGIELRSEIIERLISTNEEAFLKDLDDDEKIVLEKVINKITDNNPKHIYFKRPDRG
jgi:DNA-binding MarR family transcriptional regulator